MHSAFQVALKNLEAQAHEITRHFGRRGHTAQMDNLELQLLERVAEFEQAVSSDRAGEPCGCCGMEITRIGEGCPNCGSVAECSAH